MRKSVVLQTVFFILSTTIFGFSGFVHLHTDDFKNSFPLLKSNKIWVNLQKNDSYKEFKNSKLYLRLSDEFERINKDHDYITEDFLSTIPASKADFYLMDIGSLSFLISLEIDKAQMETISNLNSENLPNKKIGDYDVFEKGGIFISFYKNKTLIASDVKFISEYIKDGKSYETIKPEKGFSNSLYLDMDKILSTPYLKTYWFTRDKSPLLNTKEVSISFNLTKKEFSEVGEIVYSSPITEGESGKKIELDSIFSVINTSEPFSWKIFDKIKFTSYSSTNSAEIVFAPYSGTIDDLKKMVLEKHRVSVWKENAGVVEINYGVLNRDKLFLSLKDGNLLISTDSSLITKAKIVDTTSIKEINIKGSSFIKKISAETSQKEKINITYANFINNFVVPYLSNINNFEHKYFLKEGKAFFETKIKF
ncbi:hypothetical protein JXR93_06645 [bacterium]|nr:hypothetical protein [bacterium]